MKPGFYSGKVYTHSLGISCCFRQWRATHSHCRFLHGYALQVTLCFKATELDQRNWVVDFGGLKDVKEWIMQTFDHKTVVAVDDPAIDEFKKMQDAGLVDIILMENVGCEWFAKVIYEFVKRWLNEDYKTTYGIAPETSNLFYVKVEEHAGNFAMYSEAE